MKRTKSMVYNPTTESRELFLYATNDGILYRQMISPVIENMKRKVVKGIYDAEKAQAAYYRIATEASNHYYRDFGYKFSVQDRFTAACDMVEYYEDEVLYTV